MAVSTSSTSSMALSQRICAAQLTSAVKVKLAKRNGRVDTEVVGVAETKLADPGKVGLVLVCADELHASLEGSGGEVRVKSADDGVDLLLLAVGKLGDGAALVRDDTVVLVRAAEVALVKGVPPVLGESLVAGHALVDLGELLVLGRQVAHEVETADLLLREEAETLVGADVDTVGLGAHKGGTDNHAGTDKDDGETEVVAKEGEAPGSSEGRSTGLGGEEETEVVAVLVENGQAVDELAEEVVGEGAAESFLVAGFR